MRVLQLVPTLRVGGAERMAALLAVHLHQSGYTAALASMFDPPGTWIEAELRAAGVSLYFLAKRSGLDLRMISRVARVLRAFRPDVLHTHMGVLKYALPALVAWRRCAVVHTVHNLAQHEVERPSRILQNVAFRARVVPVAIGDGVARSIWETYGPAPAHVIPNGIPVSQYASQAGAREEGRRALGLPPDAPVFVTVGSLRAQKNHALLLRAFASPRLAQIGARLLLAGDGELRPQLERLAAELGVAERVHLLGVRSDVARVLAAADVFVLASTYEGNPLTVMEAMAAGKPVVATGVGCVPELVASEAGRLVPPGDVNALEAAMYEVAADPTLARARGASAARIAAARFDASLMGRSYEALYAEVSARRQGSAARAGLGLPRHG